MRINEVEALVGITKKNIRFYEAEGLLTPRRSSANGYRDYGEAEVETLRRIKLMRKLGLPLEDIRRMQTGSLTVGDAMRRHLVALERQRADLESAAAACGDLSGCPARLEELDAGAILEQLARQEEEGIRFMDKQKQDRRRCVGPAVAAAVMAALMAGVMALMLWAFRAAPAGAPPMPLLVLLLAIPAAVIFGVVIALILRLRELRRDELEDAKHY